MRTNQFLPIPFVSSNYVQTWQGTPVLERTINSRYIGVPAAVLVVFSSALTAFVIASFRFPRCNSLFGSAFYIFRIVFFIGQRYSWRES